MELYICADIGAGDNSGTGGQHLCARHGCQHGLRRHSWRLSVPGHHHLERAGPQQHDAAAGSGCAVCLRRLCDGCDPSLKDLHITLQRIALVRPPTRRCGHNHKLAADSYIQDGCVCHKGARPARLCRWIHPRSAQKDTTKVLSQYLCDSLPSLASDFTASARAVCRTKTWHRLLALSSTRSSSACSTTTAA